jgi:hypothetical protein
VWVLCPLENADSEIDRRGLEAESKQPAGEVLRDSNLWTVCGATGENQTNDARIELAKSP